MPDNSDEQAQTQARTQARAHARASIAETLGLGLLLGALPALAVAKVPQWAFGDSSKSLPKYLQIELGKFVGRHANVKQLRVLVPAQPLQGLLESRALARASAGVPGYNQPFALEGSRWLREVPGRRRRDPVFLYLHGGGYMITTMPPQVSWMLRFSGRLERASVLAVDYTVTPGGRWPQQRSEALAAYRELQKSCERIILLGDSAGGHLALNMCDELHAQGMEPPFGVVLVSPWADLLPRSEGSAVQNAKHDYIEPGEYASLLFASAEQLLLPAVNPCRGDAAYWQGKLGRNTCCTWGEWEVLADCCAEISQKCGIADVYVEPRGLHDALILNPNAGAMEFIEGCVRRWLGERERPRL